MRSVVVALSMLAIIAIPSEASAKCPKPAKPAKEKYDDGSIRSIGCKLTDGSKHGDYEEWAANGTLIARGSFDKDKRVGDWSTWYDSGKVKEECSYKRGERDGDCAEWHSTGKQKSSSVWNDGRRDGPWKLWNKDGILIEDGSYVADFSQTGLDHRDGPLTRYYDTGEKRSEEEYDHGDASGPWVEWYKNGVVMRMGEKRGDRFSGQVEEWHDTGRKSMVGVYREGLLTGEVTFYARSGRLLEVANYREGSRHGLAKVYNQAGDTSVVQCYQYGERQWVTGDTRRAESMECPDPFAVVFKPEIQEGRDFSEGFAAVNIGGKWGFINDNGGIAIAPQFQNVRYFYRGIAGVTSDGSTWYAVDKTGTKVQGARVPSSGSRGSSGGIVRVVRGGKVDYLRRGKSLWESTEKPPTKSPVLFRVQKDGKWGYIDASGTEKIEFTYAYATDFSEGLAAVGRDGRIGFINGDGEMVIPARYQRARPFHCGLAVVAEFGGKQHYIDRFGLPVTATEFAEMNDCSDGLARVKVDQNFGFLHESGRLIISPRFDDIQDFQGGFAAVPLDHQFIDRTGRSVFTGVVSMSPFSEDLAIVNRRDAKGDHYGVLTRKGEFTVFDGDVKRTDEPTFGAFSSGLAWMRVKAGVGYVSASGKTVIDPGYLDGRDCREGLIATKLDSGWGFVDKAGKVVIEHSFADVGDFHGGVARASNGTAWGLINKSGSWVVEASYDTVENMTNGLARVGVGDTYSYVNASGSVVWSAE